MFAIGQRAARAAAALCAARLLGCAAQFGYRLFRSCPGQRTKL